MYSRRYNLSVFEINDYLFFTFHVQIMKRLTNAVYQQHIRNIYLLQWYVETYTSAFVIEDDNMEVSVELFKQSLQGEVYQSHWSRSEIRDHFLRIVSLNPRNKFKLELEVGNFFEIIDKTASTWKFITIKPNRENFKIISKELGYNEGYLVRFMSGCVNGKFILSTKARYLIYDREYGFHWLYEKVGNGIYCITLRIDTNELEITYIDIGAVRISLRFPLEEFRDTLY